MDILRVLGVLAREQFFIDNRDSPLFECSGKAVVEAKRLGSTLLDALLPPFREGDRVVSRSEPESGVSTVIAVALFTYACEVQVQWENREILIEDAVELDRGPD